MLLSWTIKMICELADSSKKKSSHELRDILLNRSSFYVSSLGDCWNWQSSPWELGGGVVQRGWLQKPRLCSRDARKVTRDVSKAVREKFSRAWNHEGFAVAPNTFSRLLNRHGGDNTCTGAYRHCILLGTDCIGRAISLVHGQKNG